MTQVPQIKVETPEFLLQYREKLRNSNLNWSSVLLIIAPKVYIMQAVPNGTTIAWPTF